MFEFLFGFVLYLFYDLKLNFTFLAFESCNVFNVAASNSITLYKYKILRFNPFTNSENFIDVLKGNNSGFVTTKKSSRILLNFFSFPEVQ